ncbi:MAG: pentapeptide repeat-containing protein [Rickettsiales endosymbiont of Dermacentor nuttalli]
MSDASYIVNNVSDKRQDSTIYHPLSQEEAIKLINDVANSEDENKIISNYQFHNLDLTSVDLSKNSIIFDKCSFKSTKINRKSFEYLLTLARNGDVNLEGIDLSQTNLSKQHIDKRHLGLSAFIPVNASNINLSDSNFSKSQLEGMVFNNSILKNSNFSGSNVKDAVFSNTDLDQTNFKGSNITAEQLSEAQNFGTARVNNAQQIELAKVLAKQKAEQLGKNNVLQTLMHKISFTIANVFSDHDMDHDSELGTQTRKILEEREKRKAQLLSQSPKL